MTKITSLYEIKEKVGEGAMSEVYKAYTNEGEVVALKVIRQFLKDDADCIERIKREANVLNKLDDEKIVRSLGVQKTNDSRLMLVQEFIDGKNLDALLKQVTSAPIPIIGSVLVSEILLGLEEAHRQGIVHRDLKPENILVTKKGNIKIADFGVAKNLESQELTLTGFMLGSPAYMSPEQIKNKGVDGRSDIFGLGVLLYQLATGELPFKANNYAQLIKSIECDVYVPPTKINKNIHPELSRIIGKALEKNPEKRFQKVYDFRYHLLKYLDLLMIHNPRKILKAFYEGNIEAEGEVERRLMQTIIMRAENAIDIGNKKEAIDLLGQALTIEPENNSVKKLLSKVHKPKISFELIPALLFIAAMFGVVLVYLNKDCNIDELAAKKLLNIPPKKVVVKEVVKPKPIIQKVKEVKAARKKIVPKKIKKALPDTNIIFYVDNDVIVFLDDIELKRPYGTKVPLNPGRHLLRLEKKGYNPISSYVDIPKGETTTINAKTRKAIN